MSASTLQHKPIKISVVTPDQTALTKDGDGMKTSAFDVLGSQAGSFQFAEVKYLDRKADTEVYNPDQQ